MNSTANYRWTIRGKKPCGLEINTIIIGSLRCTGKIRRVRDLILLEGASLEAAGEAVGIQNTKYLSTLFRKYTGMTAQECKKIHRNPGYFLG